MNRKHFVGMLTVALTVVSIAAFLWLPGQAQTTGQQPDGAVSVTAATVSSRISYQGVLKEGGAPVTGSRNMTFHFYSDSGCATPVGSVIGVPNVSVAAGLFSVKLEVSQEHFNGQGLWLGVAVGGAGNVTCEEIVPVPYALSLRPGAVIVGNSVDTPILSVTNTYSPTLEAASDGLGGSDAVFRTQSGSAVFRTAIVGIGGESSGGNFSTDSPLEFGLIARGPDKAALFMGNVVVDGDMVLEGHEVYAHSFHTRSGGVTTSGVTGDGDGTLKSVTVSQTGDGKIEITPSGQSVKDNAGNTVASLSPTGEVVAHSLHTQQGTESGAFISSAGDASLRDLNARNMLAWGNFAVLGTKSAVVATASYGERKLYADESAELYFFDRGGGQLVDGAAVITLDPVWLETVTIDADHPMRVQVTLTGDCNGVYVAEKTATSPSTGSGQASFTVRELRGGASNATFDWEVAARRKGYEDVRLAPVTPGQP